MAYADPSLTRRSGPRSCRPRPKVQVRAAKAIRAPLMPVKVAVAVFAIYDGFDFDLAIVAAPRCGLACQPMQPRSNG